MNRLNLAAAVANNRAIGNNGHMPWHLKNDLAHFKKMTLNRPCIMGYATHKSIGKPLPGRHNIVISRQSIKDCDTVISLKSALALVSNAPDIMIIGGAVIYTQALEYIIKAYDDYKAGNAPLPPHRLLITQVDLSPKADRFFPVIDKNIWNQIHIGEWTQEPNQPAYRFITYGLKS